MNILVTGGAGFLGAHTVARLVKLGHRVVVYDLAAGEAHGKEVVHVAGDITDVQKLGDVASTYQVEVVVHLATLLTAVCQANPTRAAHVNCQGTATVFDVAVRQGVRRFLFGSSVAVFDDDDTLPPGDKRPLRPSNVYGATKAFGEHLAATMQPLHPGTQLLGLRFGWIYGPGRTRGWNEVQQVIEGFALERERVRYPDYQKAHDWTYIDDAVEAIVCCLDSPPPSVTAYNVSGDYRTIGEAVAHLQHRFPGVKTESYAAPLHRVGWNFVSDGITREAGFSARVTLEEGLDQTVNAIRQVHHMPPVSP